MPFSIKVTGMEEILQSLNNLGEKVYGVAAHGLYKGAGIVADSVSSAIQGIATEPFHYAKNGQKRKPSPEEKAIVMSAKHGIAKFGKTGEKIETSVGYQNSGYAAIPWNHASSKSRTKYKINNKGRAVQSKGQKGTSVKPIPVIVNAINSGTSFMQRQPFLTKAFTKSKGAAVAAIESEIKSKLDNMNI